MFDRRLVGDIAIAILLAVPTVALSRPQASEAETQGIQSQVIENAAHADRTAVEKMKELPAE